MILLLLLLHSAAAHMPVFNDNLYEKDVTDKSWGVYTHLKQGETFKVYLDVKAGDNVSFSVNMAGSQDFEEKQYVNVSLSGHYAKDIQCDPSFTGWRRLDALIDSTQYPKVETQDKPLVFEPFGVGYYRPLADCQGKANVADKFWVDITALHDVTLSIGAGMAEQFTAEEIITMPVTILRTWMWDNYLVTWSIATAVFLALWVLEVYLAKRYDQYLQNKGSKTRCSIYNNIEPTVLVFGISLNVVHYAVRFIAIDTDMYSTSEREKDNLYIGILIHIVAPIVVLVTALLCYFYAECKGKYPLADIRVYARILLFVYASTLLWQGFFIIPLYYVGRIGGYLAIVIKDFFKYLCNCYTTYEIVPSKQEEY